VCFLLLVSLKSGGLYTYTVRVCFLALGDPRRLGAPAELSGFQCQDTIFFFKLAWLVEKVEFLRQQQYLELSLGAPHSHTHTVCLFGIHTDGVYSVRVHNAPQESSSSRSSN